MRERCPRPIPRKGAKSTCRFLSTQNLGRSSLIGQSGEKCLTVSFRPRS